MGRITDRHDDSHHHAPNENTNMLACSQLLPLACILMLLSRQESLGEEARGELNIPPPNHKGHMSCMIIPDHVIASPPTK